MKITILLALLGITTSAMENTNYDHTTSDSTTTTLDLSHADLDKLEYIPCGEELVKLDLRSNKLLRLPSHISTLANLRLLFVDQNRLNKIPHGITRLACLVGLRLDDNKLDKLPPLHELKKIEYISLKNNKLSSITDDSGTIIFPSQIRLINLNGNQLSSLPPTINTLTGLINLNVAHNKLTALPHEISDCSTLQELTFDHNEIANLPQSITKLSQLKSITYNNNHKSFIPTIARNEKLANWLPALLAKELVLKINNMNPRCCWLEQLPVEIKEKVLLDLSTGTSLIQDCDAIINLSQTNKQFHALLRKSPFFSARLTNQLANDHDASHLLIELCSNSSDPTKRDTLFQNQTTHNLYIMLQDIRRELTSNSTHRARAIGSFLMKKISHKNIQAHYEHARPNSITPIVWEYDESILTTPYDKDNFVLKLQLIPNTPFYTSKKRTIHRLGARGIISSTTKESLRDQRNKDENKHGFGICKLFPVHYTFNELLDGYPSQLGQEKYQPITNFITVQKDNKIIAAFVGKWNKTFVLCRINTDGSLDTRFGENGIIDTGIKYLHERNIERLFRLSALSEDEREEFLAHEQLDNFVTIDHRTGDIIFKYQDATKKYDYNGKNIS